MEEIIRRYRNDPIFHAIVETIRKMIGKDTTPSELREAVLLACYITEIENPMPSWYRLRKTADELCQDFKDHL